MPYYFNNTKVHSVRYAGFINGISQAVDENMLKPQFSPDAQNMSISDGILKTAKGYSKFITTGLTAPIESISVFYLYNGGTRITYYLAATSNNLYTWTGLEWLSIKGAETISSGKFQCINYQDGNEQIIIMTNGIDPIYKWNGTGDIQKLYYVAEDDQAPKGACITLHYERVWVGVSQDKPNSIFYSDNLDPDNWSYSTTEGGEIEFPTWDGDRILAIKNILGNVVVLKQKSLTAILGTYPNEYIKDEIFASDGTIATESVCTAHDRAFFMSNRGIMVYNGTKAEQLTPYALRHVYESINQDYIGSATGIVYNGKLFMSFPSGASITNNKVIEYDLNTKSLMLRNVNVQQFVIVDDELLFIKPGGDYIYKYDAGTTYDGSTIDAYWFTPRNDMSQPTAYKHLQSLHVDCWGEGENPQMLVSVICDGAISESHTIDLPLNRRVLKIPFKSRGFKIGFKVQNVDGSQINLASMTAYSEVEAS